MLHPGLKQEPFFKNDGTPATNIEAGNSLWAPISIEGPYTDCNGNKQQGQIIGVALSERLIRKETLNP